MIDRITIDPRICEGRPTIRGMRITVDFVLKLLGDRMDADQIVAAYPELEKEDDRFRTHMHRATRRSRSIYSALEPPWASMLIRLKGRVHTRLEIQVELITQVTILDQRPLGPIFRTRVSATDVFRAAAARCPIHVHDDVSKTGLRHNSNLRYTSQWAHGKSPSSEGR